MMAGTLAGGISRMLDGLRGLCMHGFTLTREGQTVAKGIWAPMREEVPHRVFSVSKSMTSLAVGLLEADGKLRLSDEICGYFPDKLPEIVPGPLRRLTIRDMLRMATCHSFITYKQTDDGDWTRTFFTVPPTHEPGTVFSYDTSASHTLAALAERLSGMPLTRFLQARLFDAIGAADEKRWLTDPAGVSQGGTGLVMTLSDLTKTALFCMDGGRGTALEGYLREAVHKQIDTPLQAKDEEKFGYGYQFWRVRNNGFAMYGLGGQLAVCLPDKRTVFCTVADTQLDPNGVQKIYDAFFGEVYPALSGGAPQSEWDALEEKLQTLKIAPVDNDGTLAAPLGREYAFDKNPMELRYLCLKDRELTLENASGRHVLPFGVGEWAKSAFPGTREPCIASGGWAAPGVFRLQCHLIGDSPCGVDMLLSFSGDGVTVQMRSVREIYTQNYSGMVSGKRIRKTRNSFLGVNASPSRLRAFRWG